MKRKERVLKRRVPKHTMIDRAKVLVLHKRIVPDGHPGLTSHDFV